MALPDIPLDDRRFDDLVAELRRRIPAYTPEWTDHNESDPGIALIQLFAWLEEVLLWRLNRLPDKAYVKFLQLVALDLLPPSAARAELTFTLTSRDLPFAVPVPQGTRVGLASAAETPVVFETADNLDAMGAALQAVQSYDGARYQVVTELNRLDGKSFLPFGATPQRNAALYLGFDRPWPEGPYRIPLTFHVDPVGDAASVQGGGVTRAPPVSGAWEYWAGDAQGWQALTLVSDGTIAFTRSGVVLLQPPTGFQATKYGALKRTSDPPLYWVRLRIDQVVGAGYEAAPRIVDVLTNTVAALNSVTEEGELLGASTGLPDQTFQLRNFPVLPEDPPVPGIVEVDEGDGFTLWTEVGDFAASARDSKHYTLDHATGVVAFGDGVRGKIPRWLSADGSNREPSDVPNVRVTRYHWGGGAQGNAGAASITALEETIPFVDAVSNLRPAAGGADPEDLERAKARAPQSLRTRSRAVTGEDFAFLAAETPGAHIRRAIPLPLRIPRPGGAPVSPAALPDISYPGAVTVVVVPDVPGSRRPTPNEETLRIVAEWLDRHRLLTTELYVTGPRYREVEIVAQVVAQAGAELGAVTTAVQQSLLTWFDPVTGGADGAGWPIGGTIYASETLGRILKTPGVQRVVGQLRTFVDGEKQPDGADVPLAPDELACSVRHALEVIRAP